MLFLLFSYRCSGIHKSGSPHTPQGFAKKILHPSGYTITDCDIIYYGMKDVSAHNHKVMKGLPYSLKDEGPFCKTPG